MASLTVANPPPELTVYTALEDDSCMGDKGSITPEEWRIRCLALEPGRGDEPIRCELIHSLLGDCENTYEALSYTWGNRSHKSIISVNGQPFEITQNLKAALRHLRHEHSRRLLWIDAICINQSDMTEVNRHVGRMWAVYEKSHAVAVFLGESQANSRLALRLLSLLSRLPSETSSRRAQIFGLLRSRRMKSDWKALHHLMQRAWWNRAWIIQEYAVSQKVVFYCGRDFLDGDEFNRAMEFLIDFKFNGAVAESDLRMIRQIASSPLSHLLTVRRQYQQSVFKSEKNPLEVLYRSRSSKSSDPRDKVYSLFRLIGEIPTLKPDYSRSVQELYKDVVKAVVETSGTLEILSHHNRGITSISDLPTWCPDWTVMHGKRLLLCTKKYCAAGDTQAHAQIFGGRLTIKGKVLDQIRWLSPLFQSRDFSTDERLRQTISNLRSRVFRKSKLAKRHESGIIQMFDEAIVSSRVLERYPDGWRPRTLTSSDVGHMWQALTTANHQSRYVNDEDRKLIKTFKDAVHSTLFGRCFFVSQQGHIGVVDSAAKIGSVVVVALGGEVLYALHKVEHDLKHDTSEPDVTIYNLVGECYMHGFMAGEGLMDAADGDGVVDLNLF